MISRRFLSSFLLLAALLVPLNAVADTKIAVVDMQRAILQTEDGLRAQATIKKFFDRRQKDLDHRQDQLRRERDDLEKQARVLSRAAWRRRMEHWQRRMLEVQTLFIEYNKELQKKQNQLTKPIIRKMFSVVRRIARRRGIDLVIDKGAVVYAPSDLQLTDMAVQMYNSGEIPSDGDDEPKPDKPSDKKKPPEDPPPPAPDPPPADSAKPK